MIEKSDELLEQIREKGLYKVLEEELAINKNLTLTEEEREQIKKMVEEETGLKDVEIYTLQELDDEMLDIAEEQGVPENLLNYLDTIAIIRDEILSGFLDYANFKKNGINFLVFWRAE